MWLDQKNRVVKIEGHSYPLERVHYYVQAKAALSAKPPPPLDLSKFTVGKVAK